jgi:hypothetical protein
VCCGSLKHALLNIRFASSVDRYILFGPELFDSIVGGFARGCDNNPINARRIPQTADDMCEHVVIIKR